MQNIKAAENLQLGTLSSGVEGPSREMMCSIIESILGPPPTKVMVVPYTQWGGTVCNVIYDIEYGTFTAAPQRLDSHGIIGVCVLNDGHVLCTTRNGFFKVTPAWFMERNKHRLLIGNLPHRNNCGFVFSQYMHMVQLGDNEILCVRASVEYPRNRIPQYRNVVFNMLDGTFTILLHRKVWAFSWSVECVTLPGGDVFITDIDRDSAAVVHPKCFIFNRKTRKFAPKTTMNFPRWDYGSCITLEGTVFTCGGHCYAIGHNAASCACEEYDPVADIWVALPNIPYLCPNPKCTTLPDGKILIIADMYCHTDERVRNGLMRRGLCLIYDRTTKTFTRQPVGVTMASDFVLIPLDDTE
jgi:hypothetical protein